MGGRIQAGADMTIYLRQLGDGVRFVLCRTGQKYQKVRREPGQWTRITVLMDGSNRETTLHHACHVKPLVRA
jgi:hypothetical protein